MFGWAWSLRINFSFTISIEFEKWSGRLWNSSESTKNHFLCYSSFFLYLIFDIFKIVARRYLLLHHFQYFFFTMPIRIHNLTTYNIFSITTTTTAVAMKKKREEIKKKQIRKNALCFTMQLSLCFIVFEYLRLWDTRERITKNKRKMCARTID